MTPRHLLMSAGIAALLAGSATAQQTTEDAATGTMGGDAAATGAVETDPGVAAPAPEYTSLEEMTVGNVLSLTVLSPAGETIGDIDYVIEDAGGASAVIGVGGFLGLGEHTVAVPLGDFEYDAEQHVLRLPTDKATLEAQEEIDESALESLPDETPVATLLDSDAATGSAGSGDDAGMSEDSATEEGATDDGAMSEGAEAGATEDGTTSDSTQGADAEGGATTDDTSATAEGSVEGSATDDAGATAEGGAEADAMEEGAAEEEIEDEAQKNSDG